MRAIYALQSTSTTCFVSVYMRSGIGLRVPFTNRAAVTVDNKYELGHVYATGHKRITTSLIRNACG